MKRLFLIIIAVFNLFYLSPYAAAKSLDGQYTIVKDDMLEMKVLEQPELSNIVVTVAPDGAITFPYIGSVRVEGMTLVQAEKEIARRLGQGYIKYPVVSIRLIKTSMVRKIYVYGEVVRPGFFQYEEDMTVLKALSLSVGVTPFGNYGKFKLRRRQPGGGYQDILEADFNNGYLENKKVENTPLRIEDILIVERNKQISVHGEVQRAGQYVLEKDMTLIKALSTAGGVSITGLYGELKLRRKLEGELGYKDIVELNLNNGLIEDKKIENMLLQPDDMLIVDRSRTFFVHGEVSRPAQYVLEKDMPIIKGLATAGGVSSNGLYGKLKLRRKLDGETSYKDIVEANFNNGLIEDRKIEDMLLQPDDILIIERNKTYFMYGEVGRIGEFTLEENMTVFKAISISGGFTKWGSPSRVKVLRQKEDGSGHTIIKVNINDVIEGKAGADVKLQRGDIIVVSTGIL